MLVVVKLEEKASHLYGPAHVVAEAHEEHVCFVSHVLRGSKTDGKLLRCLTARLSL
jgi:hypothetical protein